MSKKETRYNIRQVVELTGVSEFTLRGWELRYKVVSPQRSSTGRRFYNYEDLLKLKILKDLVARGHRIGNISNLNIDDLHSLYEKLEVSRELQSKVQSKFDKPISEIILYANKFAWSKAKSVIEQQRDSLNPKDFILYFLIGLLKEINHQIQNGHFSIAREHVLTAVIKESLYAIRSTSKMKNKSKKIFVITSPEGDIHELGILMASTLASLAGARNLYLGPNLPKADICETVLRCEATHLLLSSTWDKKEGAKEDFLTVLNYIDRHVPQNVHIWVAGRNAQKTQANLKRNFRLLHTLNEFAELITQ